MGATNLTNIGKKRLGLGMERCGTVITHLKLTTDSATNEAGSIMIMADMPQ
jgi:hypothetical protein